MNVQKQEQGQPKAQVHMESRDVPDDTGVRRVEVYPLARLQRRKSEL